MFVRDVESIPVLPRNKLYINKMVDNDLQDLLRPLNLVPKLMLCDKYRIKRNFFSPNSFIYNVLAVFYFIVFRCISLYSIIDLCLNVHQGDFDIFFATTNCFDMILFSIGYFINIYVCIMESDNNILLILKIQYVLRSLKMDRRYLKSLITSSWCSVILIHVFFIGIGSYYCYYFSKLRIFDVVAQYPNVFFDVYVIYASLLIKLLERMRRVWIETVENERNVNNSEREYFLAIILDVYFNIQDANTIIEKTFQIQFAFYAVHVTFQSIKNVMTMRAIRNLVMIKNVKYFLLLFISQTWLVKSIIVFIYLSVECERFYATMRDVQSTRILLMKSEEINELDMRVFKNIHRSRRSSFRKVNSCGMFQVDAQLPLQLSKLITSYIIVCLQFAFL